MQLLEVSGVVRPLQWSLGVKGLSVEKTFLVWIRGGRRGLVK